MEPSPQWDALRYHEETKHHLDRYAPSPNALDWDSQPNPFRYYDGITPTLLPLLKRDPEGNHLDLYERQRNPFWEMHFDPPPTQGDFHRRDPWGFQSVAGFLELSLGLSAWKSLRHNAPADAGPRWALRMNPSSGNLHPTEAYVILPPIEGPDGGLYHYHPYLHALERRAAVPRSYADRWRSHFQSPGFLIGLTHVAWREAWKYGARAWRYCQHDLGHAAAALSLAGNLLGWKITYLSSVSDAELADVLGTNRTTWSDLEEEQPQALFFVSPGQQKAIPRGLPSDLIQAFKTLPLDGKPNQLSPTHVAWPLIQTAETATRRPKLPESSIRFTSPAIVRAPTPAIPAATLIRQRRSAVAFDGQTTITLAQFTAILDKTLPRNGMAPFDLEWGEPLVHLVLFVHRVIGLESGIYFLPRNEEDVPLFKRSLGRDLRWSAVPGTLPLFLLKPGDCQSDATRVSCHQTIAGRSAFSLGMLARFRPVIEREPWRYKTMFWEAGMIGQVLYLEAEAYGLRGTGIGCFFDDEVHKLLGFKTQDFQSLYHFTIGGPVDDPRLSSEPPYHHLPKDRR